MERHHFGRKPASDACIQGTDWAVVVSWQRPPAPFNQVAVMATKMGGQRVEIGACY